MKFIWTRRIVLTITALWAVYNLFQLYQPLNTYWANEETLEKQLTSIFAAGASTGGLEERWLRERDVTAGLRSLTLAPSDRRFKQLIEGWRTHDPVIDIAKQVIAADDVSVPYYRDLFISLALFAFALAFLWPSAMAGTGGKAVTLGSLALLITAILALVYYDRAENRCLTALLEDETPCSLAAMRFYTQIKFVLLWLVSLTTLLVLIAGIRRQVRSWREPNLRDEPLAPQKQGGDYRELLAEEQKRLAEEQQSIDGTAADTLSGALGAGLAPLLGTPTLAQWYEGSSPPISDPPKKFNLVIKNSPRTYNQVNVPRKYGAGRRFTIYWTWSYPWEANRDVTEMDNRFSTMTEVRRVAWPSYEKPEFLERAFLQGISGTLELFHLSTVRFQNIVGEVTGQPVVVYQRIDQAGQRLPIDERMLADTDTLMVFGLDHMITEQEASQEEIEAVKKFLTREGTCVILGPHHDVGATQDVKRLQMEYAHHGDPLVPRQQRFGLYTRTLMKGLGVPVENRFGLRPAVIKDTNQIAPITAMRDLDTQGWLTNVTTFNFHQHLPHYALTTEDARSIRVLARQPIDLTRPHPFIEAGNKDFNMFLWMPPAGTRAGHILLADLTLFTTLFGGAESLDNFWSNLSTKG